MLSPLFHRAWNSLGLFGSQNPIKAGRDVGLRAAAPVPASTTHLPSLEKPNPSSPGALWSSPVTAAPPCSGQPTLESGKVLQHHSSISLFPHPTLPASWSCSELPVWDWKEILPLVCCQHRHHQLQECWATSAGCSSKRDPGAQPDPAEEEEKTLELQLCGSRRSWLGFHWKPLGLRTSRAASSHLGETPAPAGATGSTHWNSSSIPALWPGYVKLLEVFPAL